MAASSKSVAKLGKANARLARARGAAAKPKRCGGRRARVEPSGATANKSEAGDAPEKAGGGDATGLDVMLARPETLRSDRRGILIDSRSVVRARRRMPMRHSCSSPRAKNFSSLLKFN